MSENTNQVNYGWGVTLDMTHKVPAINKRIFNTYNDALAFANDISDSAIGGLLLTVIADGDNNGAYFVKKAKMTSNDNAELVKLTQDSDTINADRTKLTSQITVAGGPLANVTNWPSNWFDSKNNRIIPNNLSLRQIFEGLFLEVTNGSVEWGSIIWNPTMDAPTVVVKDENGTNITSNTNLEVGSKVVVSYTAGGTIRNNTRKSTLSFDPGYFNSLDDEYQDSTKVVQKTGSQSGTLITTATWNGSSVTSGDRVTVGAGTNTFKVAHSGITCSVEALDTTTVYGSTNTHVIVPELVATLTDSKPTDKTPENSASNNKVNGVRAYWVGSLSKAISTFDSATVRSLTSIKGIGSPRTSISVQQSHFQVVIITTKEISKVTSANQSGAAITSSFNSKGIHQIKGANDFEATNYYVYEYSVDSNGNGFNADTFTVTYK